MSADSIAVNVVYFAVLRDHAGVAGETVNTRADSAAALYRELSERHGFPALDPLKVAINDEFSQWSAPLRAGDTVVFIPPVAGG